MSLKTYILSVLLIAGIATLLAYYFLGGFNERELALVEVDGYRLVGKEYRGTLGTKGLEEIFFEVQQKALEGEYAGALAIVVLQEPKDEKDTLHQFIGILLEDPAGPVPAGWETFELNAEQAVRSTIRSHNLVMPKPHAIREEIEAFAQEKDVALRPEITIEKYLGERHLQVEVPVQE